MVSFLNNMLTKSGSKRSLSSNGVTKPKRVQSSAYSAYITKNLENKNAGYNNIVGVLAAQSLRDLYVVVDHEGLYSTRTLLGAGVPANRIVAISADENTSVIRAMRRTGKLLGVRVCNMKASDCIEELNADSKENVFFVLDLMCTWNPDTTPFDNPKNLIDTIAEKFPKSTTVINLSLRAKNRSRGIKHSRQIAIIAKDVREMRANYHLNGQTIFCEKYRQIAGESQPMQPVIIEFERAIEIN